LKTKELLKYLRIDRWPTVWCPGCGNGIILKAFLEAVDQLKLKKDRVAVVSGIGCSSRATGYLDFNTMHTLHGRAISFATGVKLARPEFKVIVMGGDGDLASIGGNHFIHACRRNIDLTVIVFNNMIYGMTGGQYSPTTPEEEMASTAPYGHIEQPFDIAELALSSGATYVARATVYHYNLLVRYIKEAIAHKGISVVDAITNCHTYYGRYNGMPEPYQMMEYFKNNSVTLERAKNMSKEELKGKIIVGVFKKEEGKPCYLDRYEKIREKAMSKGR